MEGRRFKAPSIKENKKIYLGRVKLTDEAIKKRILFLFASLIQSIKKTATKKTNVELQLVEKTIKKIKAQKEKIFKALENEIIEARLITVKREARAKGAVLVKKFKKLTKFIKRERKCLDQLIILHRQVKNGKISKEFFREIPKIEPIVKISYVDHQDRQFHTKKKRNR